LNFILNDEEATEDTYNLLTKFFEVNKIQNKQVELKNITDKWIGNVWLKKILLLFNGVKLKLSIHLSKFISPSFQEIRQELKEINLGFTKNVQIDIGFLQETSKSSIYTFFTLYSRSHMRLETDVTRSISNLFSWDTEEDFDNLKINYPLMVRGYEVDAYGYIIK